MVSANAEPAVRRVIALVLVLGALHLSGCAPAPLSGAEDDADALTAIAEFNRQYLKALNEGDIDLLASLTTENHLMISSGAEPLTGKAALIDVMTGGFERFDFEESWTPLETVVSGDLAYQRGTFIVVARPKAAGEEIRMTGNFLRIYRRQADGAWFMTHDMHNGN